MEGEGEKVKQMNCIFDCNDIDNRLTRGKKQRTSILFLSSISNAIEGQTSINILSFIQTLRDRTENRSTRVRFRVI